MSRKIDGRLLSILRIEGGETLLEATLEFVAKSRAIKEAEKVLGELGYTPATMPDPRSPEEVQADRQMLEQLRSNHDTTSLVWFMAGWAFNPDGDRRASAKEVEQHVRLDWAVEMVSSGDELIDLGRRVRELLDRSGVPYEFNELVETVAHDFDSVKHNLETLSTARNGCVELSA